jgi:hypothetical protein
MNHRFSIKLSFRDSDLFEFLEATELLHHGIDFQGIEFAGNHLYLVNFASFLKECGEDIDDHDAIVFAGVFLMRLQKLIGEVEGVCVFI